MLDVSTRRLIMEKFGGAVDDLVRDLYSPVQRSISVVQEPEITSRLCQRLEDRLDGERAGEYVFRVIAQSMPDRGPMSVEKVTGADIFLSVSLDGPDGFDKGLFVQAKYDRNLDRADLMNSCRRMVHHVGSGSAYVWVYEPDGVKVLSRGQVGKMVGNTLDGLAPRSVAGLTGRILDCNAGSRDWGIKMGPRRRDDVRERLTQVRAQNALDVALKRAG